MADEALSINERWLTDFERYLRTERQVSAYTVRNYLFELQRIEKLFSETDSWLSLQHESLQAMLAKLHRKGLSPRSLSLTLSSLKQFYEFLLREQQIKVNPAIV